MARTTFKSNGTEGLSLFVYVVLLPSIYTIGKYLYRPSDLFLKASILLVVDLPGHDHLQIYCDVLDTLECDPLLGMVSPPLLALLGVIPLSIISLSALYPQWSPPPLRHACAVQVARRLPRDGPMFPVPVRPRQPCCNVHGHPRHALDPPWEPPR